MYLKSDPAEVTALENGAVDAIVTQPPTGTQTRDKGFKKIMDFTNYPAAANAYTVKATTSTRTSKAVGRLREVRGASACRSCTNDKAPTIASIRKHSGNDNEALAEYSYDFFEPLWARTPTVDPALVEPGVRRRPAAKGDGPTPMDTRVRRQLASSTS